MDILKWKRGIIDGISKYKYVLVLILLGLGLMLLPGKQKETETVSKRMPDPVPQQDLTEALEEILQNIHGAGEVQVLLSISQGEQVLYQTDVTQTESDGRSDKRTETVLITDSERNASGLIHQTNPPTYMGAIVLAQGADDPVVKLDLVRAVSNMTGLGADKISVLKMK